MKKICSNNAHKWQYWENEPNLRTCTRCHYWERFIPFPDRPGEWIGIFWDASKCNQWWWKFATAEENAIAMYDDWESFFFCLVDGSKMPKQVFIYPKGYKQCMKAGYAAIKCPYETQQLESEGIPEFTIYSDSRFYRPLSFSVYEVLEIGYILRTVIWRKVRDIRRFGIFWTGEIHPGKSPLPTLDISSIDLDRSWAKEQIKLLSSIEIPNPKDNSGGHDGQTFGVHRKDALDVEWWCNGPKEWSDLVAWTKACVDYLADLYDKHFGSQNSPADDVSSSESIRKYLQLI